MTRRMREGLGPDHWPVRKENLYRALLAFVLMLMLVIGLTVTDVPEPVTQEPTAEQSPTLLAPADLPSSAGVGSIPEAGLPAWARPVDKETQETPLDEPPPDDVAADKEPAAGALTAAKPAGEHAHGKAADAQSPAALARAAEGAYAKQTAGQVQTPPPKQAADVEAATATIERKPVPSEQPAVSAAQPKTTRPGATGSDAGSSGAAFRIRLGDFEALDVAQPRLAELVAKGYPAALQIRVAAGPYRERQQAQQAISKLRREQGLSGLLVAGPKEVGSLVQVGVFSDAANAEGLARRLSAWGYPAVQQGRLVVGPYPDRATADSVLLRLREEGVANGTATVLSSS